MKSIFLKRKSINAFGLLELHCFKGQYKIRTRKNYKIVKCVFYNLIRDKQSEASQLFTDYFY